MIVNIDRFVKMRKLEDAIANDETQYIYSQYLIHSAENAKNPEHKVRQYSDKCLVLRFTWTRDPDCPLLLCIVCGKKLANMPWGQLN